MPDGMRRPRTAAEELLRLARTGDAASGHVRGVIGKSVQLRIPLRDLVDLRRCVLILRAFCLEVERLSKGAPETDTALLAIWHEARKTQARFSSHPK